MGLFAAKCRSTARLDGKTAVVTGGNAGIGLCTVEDFVRRGARVVIACRDEERGRSAAEEVRKRTAGDQGAGEVRVVRLDLSSLASVRACAKELLATEPHIHLLINNAGVMSHPDARTEDGFEMHLAVNHLGHFLLTCLLMPRIRASAPARIVNVSSLAHQLVGWMDFENLNWEKNYNPTFAYGRSKLSNVLFTKELAKRLEGSGVNTYSLHPGVIGTGLGRHLGSAYFPGATWMYNHIGIYFMLSPKQGAQTTIYCAVSESVADESGLYYSDCSKKRPSSHARNPEFATRLWEESMKLVGLEHWDPITSNGTPDYLFDIKITD